jgi:hypothetical protein
MLESNLSADLGGRKPRRDVRLRVSLRFVDASGPASCVKLIVALLTLPQVDATLP